MLRHVNIGQHARLSQASSFAIETNATRWNVPAQCASAGGDWSDIVSVSEDILAISVGDVSGHGEPASEMMGVLRSAILGAVRESQIPSDVLAMANSLAYGHPNGVIATAVVAFLNRRQRTFTFASAGHPPPFLVTRSAHAFLSHGPGDLPLGVFPLHRSAEYVLALPADGLIVLYTDGMTEHTRDMFSGERELADTCLRVYDSPELDAARAIAEYVFRSGRGNDDAAVVAIRTTPLHTSARRSRLTSRNARTSPAIA